MKRRQIQKVALSLLVVGVLGAIASFGVFGLFTSTTTNPGNQLSSGTVVIGDNSSGTALYNISNAKPGTTSTTCIKVTYTGSLPADVKLYMPSSVGSLAQYEDLTITPGTQSSPSFPSCTGFTPAAGGALFTGTLQGLSTANNAYSNGILTYPGSQTQWNTNDSIVYEFTVTLDASTPNSAQGSNTNSHSFTWEARNQ
ncbi:MAG TPA: hypothetical protein VNY83_00430 [Solirubrobacterales bacterium]|jgi:hypothetical protein|nr:hypothetical protein [Solirubrobacterales bacterium]